MRIVLALWKRNIKKFISDRVRLAFTIIMPLFFVYVFNAIFKIDNVENPVAYMTSGVIIITVFQGSVTVASSTIDDLVSGFLKEILVSPIKRIHIAIGQLLSAATIATFQGVLIFLVSLAVGISFGSVGNTLLAILLMIFVGLCFSGVGLFMATIIKSTQTFQIAENALMLPLTFLSGAYIPLSLLPTPARVLAYFNPMTYAVAFFRWIVLDKTHLSNEELLLQGLAFEIKGVLITPIHGMVIILCFGIAFLLLSTYFFTKSDLSKVNRNAEESIY